MWWTCRPHVTFPRGTAPDISRMTKDGLAWRVSHGKAYGFLRSEQKSGYRPTVSTSASLPPEKTVLHLAPFVRLYRYREISYKPDQ